MQVFFDLEESGGGQGVEILIKAGPVFTEERVHDLRDTLKLGDVVKASGQLEHAGSHILHLSSIVVLERWRDTNPKRHFIPRCLSHGSETASPGMRPETQPAAAEITQATQEASQTAHPAHDQGDDGIALQHNDKAQLIGTQPANLQLCKFHINGRCAKGASCPFLHVDVHAAPRVRQAWIADRSGLHPIQLFYHMTGAVSQVCGQGPAREYETVSYLM